MYVPEVCPSVFTAPFVDDFLICLADSFKSSSSLLSSIISSSLFKSQFKMLPSPLVTDGSITCFRKDVAISTRASCDFTRFLTSLGRRLYYENTDNSSMKLVLSMGSVLSRVAENGSYISASISPAISH